MQRRAFLSNPESRPGYGRGGLYSCKTTVNNDLLTWILPLYSIKPSFLNLFMKKFTRERVVPTMLQRLLRHFRQCAHRLILFSIPRQKQQRSRQPLLARIEQLIDQILFHSDVMRQHVSDEMVR